MVIPVHDVNPLRRTPLVTIALVVANIVVFLLALAPQSGDTAAGQLCRQADGAWRRPPPRYPRRFR